MIASELGYIVLKDVLLKDIGHFTRATSVSSTQLVINYYRYEFLEYSILNFIVSTQSRVLRL